jgi:hypothetical protein
MLTQIIPIVETFPKGNFLFNEIEFEDAFGQNLVVVLPVHKMRNKRKQKLERFHRGHHFQDYCVQIHVYDFYLFLLA